ncbi:MAG: hypothetical protein ACI8TX_000068 [Hyphomicrobiaceae bacterium]|jgi:hypothetical protein
MPIADSAAPSIDFLVRKDALTDTRFVEGPSAADTTLATGEVLLAVDSYAMTANNITYAVLGEMMNYWDFFPAPESWGRIPVWGFAEIVASAHPDLKVGERVYGYLPMSTHLRVQADSVTPAGFIDAVAHRAERSLFYNQYTRVAADPSYDPKREAEQMLLKPLFATAFLIDDFLAAADSHGAEAVILTSASSKTSFALAHLLASREGHPVEVIGLTSPGNVAFVEGLGCYDSVVTYNDVATLAASRPSVIVDMAGNAAVLGAVHNHFGDQLKFSLRVGATHWSEVGGGEPTSGPAPVFFFAPDQLAKRVSDWGMAGFQERLGAAWIGFLTPLGDWIQVERAAGSEATERVYQETLAGNARPDRGYILSPVG